MGYQVWVSEYGDTWKKEDCATLDEVEGAIWEAMKQGKAPLITRDIPYSARIKFEEGKGVEAIEGEPEGYKDTRGKGKGPVRRGAPPELQELHTGGGPDQPADSVPGGE